MNTYAAMAYMYWQTFLPSQFSAIADKDGFFAKIGEQIAAEIEAVTPSLAGPDPVGETEGDRHARLRAARLQAEKQVVRRIFPPNELGITPS